MDKAQLFDEVLHDRVVTMGIDAQVPALFKRPFDAERPDSFFGAVPSDSVYHAVGTVVKPCSISDISIGRFDVLPVNEKKRSDPHLQR